MPALYHLELVIRGPGYRERDEGGSHADLRDLLVSIPSLRELTVSLRYGMNFLPIEIVSLVSCGSASSRSGLTDVGFGSEIDGSRSHSRKLQSIAHLVGLDSHLFKI
jgi:hypothetical protein